MKGLLPLEYSGILMNSAVPHFSYKIEDNIDIFQKEGKEKLRELLGIDVIRVGYEAKKPEVEYDIYADDLCAREIFFTVESEAGVFVPCHLFIPDKSERTPLIITLHGHSTGVHTCLGRIKYPVDSSAIENQECDFAKRAIKMGYSVLALEHRGFGERGGDEKGSKCSELAFRSMMLGRTLLGERVWDVKAALDAVVGSFGDLIDTDNIAVLGYSGGGTIGTYLSALDERIKTTVIVSSISTFKASIGAMPHCACNYVPSIAKYFDMGEICQLIAPRRLIVISGEDDPIFPISGAKECVDIARVAYSAFDKEDMLTHISAKGAHKFYPEEAFSAIKKIL
jgi:dienelactone hydrolase